MLRYFIIRMALHLQFPPFLWVFQCYYWLAVKVTIVCIRKAGPVRSVYLSGSAARRDVLYGLSDLDFKVFISGQMDKNVYEEVRRRFARLRRWFPMLGTPDEKGIYFIDDFALHYKNYPLVQHLFDDRFYRHRLVWGNAIMAQLSLQHWSRLDQTLNYFWKLKYWVEKISLFAGSRDLNRIQKQYLFFKAVSDLGLIWMRIENPETPFQSREKAMGLMLERFSAPDVKHISDLLAERRALFCGQLSSEDENYLFFKRILAACLGKIRSFDDSPQGSEYKICQCERTSSPSLNAQHIERLRSISPAVGNIATQFRPFLPRSPFDSKFFGKPAYRLDCSRPLGLTEAWELKGYYDRQMNQQAVLLIREDVHWIYSANSELLDHWLSMEGSDDMLWAFCETAERIILSPCSEKRILFRLAAFHEQLHAVLNDPGWRRMKRDGFLSFIFNALSVMIFKYEFSHHRILLPTTPEDVVDYLIGHTPVQASLLDALLGEYHSVANGAVFNERFSEKAVHLLVSAASAAESGDWQGLASLNEIPDEKHLDISVVIVTLNRCAKLERCLRSILSQKRLPEEMVVIDSDSTDGTFQLVSQWKAPFPVRYIKKPLCGVAAARNEGLAAASGEIIAFIDDDMVVTPEWLEALEYAFLRDSHIGIVGGSIYNMECGRKGSVAEYMRIAESLEWDSTL